ncbi:MAG: sulfite exporter TauE/SafE family protein [Thermogutta sp.]
MQGGIAMYVFGGLSAICMGFSKTGVPGASILAVVLMAEAFRENAAFSVGALMPVLLVGDIFAISLYARDAAWSGLLRLFPYVAIGLISGAVLLRHVQGNDLRPVLGGLIVLMFALEVYRRWRGEDHVPHAWWFLLLTGWLAGFATMVGNAAGPVMTMYLLSQDLPKARFMGTCAVFFFTVNLLKTVPMAWVGMITVDTFRFASFAVPMTFIGLGLGRWVFCRMSQKTFDTVALILAGLGGIWLLIP